MEHLLTKMFRFCVTFVYFVILYRVMMNTHSTITGKPFKTPIGGEDEISQVTPASHADEFRSFETEGKDGLLKVPRENSGTELNLRFGNGDKTKVTPRKQINKEMVASRGEKFKPRVLTQAQINEIHTDLRRAFKVIFQVNTQKYSRILMFLIAHELTGYNFVEEAQEVFKMSGMTFEWPIRSNRTDDTISSRFFLYQAEELNLRIVHHFFCKEKWGPCNTWSTERSLNRS